MDSWANDESLFIARRLGSPEGVVQVYRCWSLETPIGDDAFSLIGETDVPSEINPASVWEQKDYIRFIQFLEVNSAMVNVRGHVIVRSLVKSRRVGKPDGPATYWRCLDVLPMHAFGLARPVDTHGTPQFLIIGGDLSLTSPGKGIDAKDWEAKYNNLDTEFKKLKYELDSLKASIGGVNDIQSENKRLKSEIENQKSAYQQILTTLKSVEVERDSLKVSLALSDKEFSACQIENKRLVAEIKDSSKKFETLIKSTEVERDSLKANLVALNDALTTCRSENTKLVNAIEDQKSANKQIQAERDSLKVSLDLSDKELSACQIENKRLVAEIKDSSKKFETLIKSTEVERDSLKANLVALNDTLTACRSENTKLVIEINDSSKKSGTLIKSIEVERDSLKALLVVCQTENKKLVDEIEKQKSTNKNLEVRVSDTYREKQKASQDVEKLKVEVSKLQIQVSNSVTKSFYYSSLEEEKDLWALYLAFHCLDLWISSCNGGKTLRELPSNNPINLSNFRKIGTVRVINTWMVYRNGNKVTVLCEEKPYDGASTMLWNANRISWEYNLSGKLHGTIETKAYSYNTL